VLRYRFNEFTLSPQRRLLVREGQEVPLIPRYFDLLLLLIERRREAVHRREIFERVWADAIVSESALSQAVRTIRKALDDDPREPRFIRTVSRHGYRFVFPDVIEEDEEEGGAVRSAAPSVATPAFEVLPSAAETAAEASAAEAEASVRQTVTGLVANRWPRAAAGGAVAGIIGGAVGGLILAVAPGSFAPIALAPVLAVIGGGCGALGGGAVGAGLAFAEAVARSSRERVVALILCGAMGGGLIGAAVQWLTRWSLASLVGLHLNVGGGLEGVLIGAGAGLGFAIATRRTEERFAAPRGGKRWLAASIIALSCGLAGLTLMLSGRPLAGGTIHIIADAADGSRASLAPLGRLIGEPDFGPVSSAIIAFGESAVFGLGLAYGLMRRPRSLRGPRGGHEHALAHEPESASRRD
jgi:DNA-binding winged helix-turn-helix (wHTH) protein